MKKTPADTPHVHRLPVGGHADASDDETSFGRMVPHLHWQVSYDLASVDRYLAEIEAERASIERQMEHASERVQRAKKAAERRAAAEAELGARILAAQEEFERIQQEQREAVDAIRAAAGAEADRVLAAAREEAEAMRAAATIAVRHERTDEPRP